GPSSPTRWLCWPLPADRPSPWRQSRACRSTASGASWPAFERSRPALPPMLVRFSKGPVAAQMDGLLCVRPDGTRTTSELRRRGILPHEAFHFVVETTLGWHDALFGDLARGLTLATATARTHGSQTEWTKNIQGRQAEA